MHLATHNMRGNTADRILGSWSRPARHAPGVEEGVRGGGSLAGGPAAAAVLSRAGLRRLIDRRAILHRLETGLKAIAIAELSFLCET